MLKNTLLLLLTLFPALLVATPRNDLPSCYDFLKLSDLKPESSGRELIFIIDETTTLPKSLQTSSYNHIKRFIQPGDSFQLYRLSAYMPNNFLQLEYAATLENTITPKKRNSVGMLSLKKLDRCLEQQQSVFLDSLVKKMKLSFGNEHKNIAKSEILYSLQQIGKNTHKNDVKHRLVFIVSDMLENSRFTSFYAKNQIKEINPTLELNKVEKNKLLANLTGWHVYVEAAGLGKHNAKYGYRSGKTMQKLESFWKQYFEASGATLEGFGAPALTIELQ